MKQLACIGIVSAAILLSTCQSRKDEAPAPIPPVAAFTFTGPFTTNDSVRFTNSSTDAVSYKWDFGDGSISTKVAPAHRYQQPGQYTIRLDATNPGGTQSQTTNITISPFTQPPVAAFTCIGPFTAGDTTRFTNESTNATNYRWDFGDGSTSTAATPMHIYQQPGQYTVQLTAANPGGTHSQTQGIRLSTTLAGSTCNCRIFTYTYTTPKIRLPDRVIPVGSYGTNGISFEGTDYLLVSSSPVHAEYRSKLYAASIGGSGFFDKATDTLRISYHSGGIGNPTIINYICKKN
ncbi:PKD domain-containing protein [Hymenobacter sp. ASUV-10]|uniref:PKD domain-containing protein n=1 Tax=Hymenobacter aranciens TaxID=3063996 RepID=A0ABT9BH46_9BACT|nr:PKD domain-containing protein [Hymenobacter sp. ASUV-10]MDO7876327.1 PKD domain-containing protein [Hymenobacter sp. ASUV-10]